MDLIWIDELLHCCGCLGTKRFKCINASKLPRKCSRIGRATRTYIDINSAFVCSVRPNYHMFSRCSAAIASNHGIVTSK